MMMKYVTTPYRGLGIQLVCLHAYLLAGFGVIKWDLKGSMFKTDEKKRRFPTKYLIKTYESLPRGVAEASGLLRFAKGLVV